MPPKIFKSVDLPLPDGPSKTQNSPFSTFSDKSLILQYDLSYHQSLYLNLLLLKT